MLNASSGGHYIRPKLWLLVVRRGSVRREACELQRDRATYHVGLLLNELETPVAAFSDVSSKAGVKTITYLNTVVRLRVGV